MKKATILLSLILSHFCFSQITDTGDKVGIGTTSPTEKLDVNGSVKISKSGQAKLLMEGLNNGGGYDGSLIVVKSPVTIGNPALRCAVAIPDDGNHQQSNQKIPATSQWPPINGCG